MSSTTLSADQEALVQEVTREVLQSAESDILQIVRTLFSKDDRHIFGQTEFTVRDIIQRVAVKAYEAVLAKKKMATTVPASPVPTAVRPPATTATARAGH